jgi:hypothetical protein
MQEPEIIPRTVKVTVKSRGYHGGSLFNYDIPSHRQLIHIMSDVENGIYSIDFDYYIDCSDANDNEYDKCVDNAYKELGKYQDYAIEDAVKYADTWVSEIQPPYVFNYINACDEYDACYFDLELADLSDLFRWWSNPIERNINVDVLYASYEISIIDGDGIIAYNPRLRTAIHNISIPHDIFSHLWYLDKLDIAVDLVKRIIDRLWLGVPSYFELEKEETEEIELW